MPRTLVTAAAATALALVGLALAAPQEDTYRLSATLKVRFEVPKPTGVRAGAAGRFTGTAVELENDRARVTWRLTFSRLSGRAVAAHIHSGRPGKAGGVLAPLCGPCRFGQRGTATITHAQLRVLRSGRAYVNVHTPRNQAGEIRGQIRASEVESSGDDPAPAPNPTPEPPPYP
jgi:CHRD domain